MVEWLLFNFGKSEHSASIVCQNNGGILIRTFEVSVNGLIKVNALIIN